MRFINPKRSTVQQQAIANLSEENKFLASGSAKGYAIDNYSWVADFSFKTPGNNFLNTNSGYISFFSDREIMNQEFGNVARIYETYDFFSLIQRQKYSNHTFELSRRQYAMVSSRGSEFDTIQYFNLSDQKRVDVGSSDTIFVYNNEFWRAPAFLSSGYIVQLDNANPNAKLGKAIYYNRYYWGYPWLVSSNIDLNSATVNLNPDGSDFSYWNEAVDQINGNVFLTEPSDPSDIQRILDVKLFINNPKYKYFSSSAQWVSYYNDTTHYYGQQFEPYYGSINFYDEYWNVIDPMTDPTGLDSDVTFFPEIIRNGILEPAKVIATWPRFISSGQSLESGKMILNNGVAFNEPDDQSRIVYNICKHMLTKPDDMIEPFNSNNAVVYKQDSEGNYLYCGIDIDTERNRRHSAVVMTEPYFVTGPIGNGEIVNYMFVDRYNKPINYRTQSEFLSNPAMFLKVKATKKIIDEISDLLKNPDYNTDIIETLTINNIDQNLSTLGGYGDAYYNDFGSAGLQYFLKRQEDCLDDLIGDSDNLGMVGQGHHNIFYINDASDKFGTQSLYSQLADVHKRRKINGIGFGSKIQSNGEQTTNSNYLNLYCSNYVPVNAPAPNTQEPINNEVKLFCDAEIINSSFPNERFYPMIKLPGINGYVKIIEQSSAFKINRAADGGYEVIYNVEFPYCPGSFVERSSMNFSSGYRETWILKKISYIPSGSWAADSSGRYNIDNDRYAPFADDSFCHHSLLYQPISGIRTNPSSLGGGTYEISQSNPNLISYPPQILWKKAVFNMISLTKSKLKNFRTYGTYDIRYNREDCDLKLFGLVDNRKWKFGEDKFCSYIGRENPSYICDINVSTLFNDLTSYQKNNAVLPDIKRWLFAKFSGFSNTMSVIDNVKLDTQPYNDRNKEPITNTVKTFLNDDLSSQDSSSDIIIEAWDQRCLLGVGDSRNGNWRPLSNINSDTNKVAGEPILNDLYINQDSIVRESANFPDQLIYSINLGYIDSDANINFPDSVGFATSNDMISGRSNLVLLNSKGNYTYHVAYITVYGSFYKAYIYYDPSKSILTTFDVNNLELGVPGPYTLCMAKKQMNKNISFELYTSQVVQGVAENLITRYIDIRSSSSETEYTDLQRFIDENNHLYFRIRTVKSKGYPISYENDDVSNIQYLWGDSTASFADQWINFPWRNPITTQFDTQFSWDKISTKEVIRKFGMTYFKCGSK